jgi:hypothetical protein
MPDAPLPFDQRALLRKVLIYKYLLISVTIILGGLILRNKPASGSEARAFAETFFYSGIVALILSILNDVVLHSEQETRAEIDRRDFANVFARQFFTVHADTVITDELLLQLMNSPQRRAMVLRALATFITADPNLTNAVEMNYLEPVHHPPRFKSCRAVSHLRDHNETWGTYEWACRQTMTTIVPVDEYRIFVCSDADIAAVVEASTRATDFVILLSWFDADRVRRWLEKDFHFQVSAVNPQTGRLDLLPVQMHFDLSELQSNPGCSKVQESDGLYCRLSWPNVGPGAQIDMRYECSLSLREDPFFLWTLQDFAFVDLIEIDYSQIKKHCGRVSAVPFIRSSGCVIEHDRNAGVFRVLVGGMAGPGEGAVIILRQGA